MREHRPIQLVRRGSRAALTACCVLALSAACSGGKHDPSGTAPVPTETLQPNISATAGARTTSTAALATSDTPEPASTSPTSRRPSATEQASEPTATSHGQPIVFSAGRELLPSDLASRGTGPAGRGALNVDRIVIAFAGIDAPVTAAVVTNDGVMPSPDPSQVFWYDFSIWPGQGGLPGAGGNVVLGGRSGPGVFSRAGNLSVGSYVDLVLTSGDMACYRIEFNKIAGDQDFTGITNATAEESVTLITGGPSPTQRIIIWGRRADCDAEPAAPPTPAPPAGHHKLKMAARGLQYVILEGGVVPPGIHTVDFTVELTDPSVQHQISFYDTTGRELIATEPVAGPTLMTGAFGVGPPQPPGTYTFRCSVYPQMTGSITVQS